MSCDFQACYIYVTCEIFTKINFVPVHSHIHKLSLSLTVKRSFMHLSHREIHYYYWSICVSEYGKIQIKQIIENNMHTLMRVTHIESELDYMWFISFTCFDVHINKISIYPFRLIYALNICTRICSPQIHTHTRNALVKQLCQRLWWH